MSNGFPVSGRALPADDEDALGDADPEEVVPAPDVAEVPEAAADGPEAATEGFEVVDAPVDVDPELPQAANSSDPMAPSARNRNFFGTIHLFQR